MVGSRTGAHLFKKGQSGNPNGRAKGQPNKLTADIKAMVKEALEGVGGVEYLEKQARENPVAFLSLVGKLIPHEIAGDPDNPLLAITRIECVLVEPRVIEARVIEGETVQ
jgi:hypothetical protein